MRLKFLALGLAMAGAALLTGCGSGGSNSGTGNANVRLLNASVGYASLDLKETDATSTLNSAVTFGNVGSYAGLSTSTKGMQLLASGNATVLNTPSTAGLTKDYKYTVVAWGPTGSAGSLVLDEQEAKPDTGKSKVLVLNLAQGAGALDVYVTDAATQLADVSANSPNIGVGRGDSYRVYDSKAYRIRVTAAGNKSDVRLDIPAVTLDSAQVYGLLLTSAAGGNMVNASLLTYQGSVANFQNATANVRVISALPRSASLTAAVNGTTLLNNSGSPVVSGYQNITVTNGAKLSWTVNGVAQADRTIALTASTTYGLLVWGDPAAPLVNSLVEDSVLPITAGTAKIRVVHGAQGLGPVSLVINLSPSQSNIQAGSLSGASQVNSTDQHQVEVRAGAATVFTETRTFTSGGLYIIYLSGVPGAYEARLIQQQL